MIAKSNKLKQNHKIKRVLQSIILKTTDTADYMIKVKHKRNMYSLGYILLPEWESYLHNDTFVILQCKSKV